VAADTEEGRPLSAGEGDDAGEHETGQMTPDLFTNFNGIPKGVSLLHAAAAVQELRRAEHLAAR
jgi:hypothetical protein